MSWASNSAAYTAFRNRIGIDSTRLSDAEVAAALAGALDRISNHFPSVTNATLTNQSAKRIDLSTITDDRIILAAEVPLDEDPRRFRFFYQEEDGYIRMPDYQPSAESVRIWYTKTWLISTLPNDLNEDCLTAAIAFGLTKQQIEAMTKWSVGSDADWGRALAAMIKDARDEWKDRARELRNRAASRLAVYAATHGKL